MCGLHANRSNSTTMNYSTQSRNSCQNKRAWPFLAELLLSSYVKEFAHCSACVSEKMPTN